ncbi:nickel/cobalt transporter [Streptomyces sp. NBC_01198]|uniref:nickel/cobalt transporter n=1 Tax=Streptomyces sp. NBC_01198 TaxID=2903769 RepID=UPI002E14C84F|nr:high frequency lysogenization protein HflD [Streptomyces sp. NBC_01198]
MGFTRSVRRTAAVAGVVLWLFGWACAAAPPAQAHPLGNFSINHYTGFTISSGRLDVLAVTDTAEIPTLQAATSVDTDHDGGQSAAERAAWAAARCADTSRRLAVTTPRRLALTVDSAAYVYRPGQAGLRTSRLECRLHAPLELARGPVSLEVATGVDATRVGWNEITAKGAGTHLRQSTVPASSVTDELRNYPRDLLATPRGDTRARFTAVAGEGASGATAPMAGPGADGGLTGRVEALSRQLTSLAGARRLTVLVGLLAVLLSIVLGAGHALLPGHGKTVMAAYLAGRRGRTRDAVTVGATVTITHTAGVLVIGMCLTMFSALAGDAVLNWLGVVSGALVAVVGAVLLADTVRRPHRRTRLAAAGPDEDLAQPVPVALVGAASLSSGTGGPGSSANRTATEHEHAHSPADDHSHHRDRLERRTHEHSEPHRHGPFGHHHTHPPGDGEARPFPTRGLIGLGVAGGLVPSPSALVVLLGAIALGRTVFGAVLVLAYGLGMAATLTAVGLLLVRLGSRAGRLADRPLLARLRRITPYTALLTAALVLVVGLSMMARSLQTVL